MVILKPQTNDRDEVRELTQEEFSRAVPFSEMPGRLKELLRSSERTVVPDVAPKKKKRTAA